jgi:hypothetical protein
LFGMMGLPFNSTGQGLGFMLLGIQVWQHVTNSPWDVPWNGTIGAQVMGKGPVMEQELA